MSAAGSPADVKAGRHLAGPYLGQARQEGLVQAINPAKITNLGDVQKVMKDDPVAVEAQAAEIKARYTKYFGV